MRREKSDISSEAPIEFYNHDAARFGERYTSVRFEDVQRGVLAHLPAPGSRILDVGAGSGRDAFALAEQGYIVTAVEPAVLLKKWARNRSVNAEVEWIEDRLPDLREASEPEAIFRIYLVFGRTYASASRSAGKEYVDVPRTARGRRDSRDIGERKTSKRPSRRFL